MSTNDLDLGRVADDLLDRHGGPIMGSLLVRLERHRTTGELLVGVRPLQEHPADALACFRPADVVDRARHHQRGVGRPDGRHPPFRPPRGETGDHGGG